jgi:uncharacterized protein YebE (UPF0316 family)
MILYLLIFFSKIIENTFSTLRIIVVANCKKKLGAILQGIVALVWLFVTGVLIVDVGKDPIKVIFFCLGTIIGSYLGSLLEEKLAIGNNTLICIISNKYEKKLKKLFKYNKLYLNNKYSLLILNFKRKNRNKILNAIKDIDSNSVIITENSNNIV